MSSHEEDRVDMNHFGFRADGDPNEPFSRLQINVWPSGDKAIILDSDGKEVYFKPTERQLELLGEWLVLVRQRR